MLLEDDEDEERGEGRAAASSGSLTSTTLQRPRNMEKRKRVSKSPQGFIVSLDAEDRSLRALLQRGEATLGIRDGSFSDIV
jgi:hypothetical protein